MARVATIGTHADVAPALSRPRTARTETLCMTPREPSFARVIRSIICRRSRDSYRPSERLESVYPYDVKLYLRRLSGTEGWGPHHDSSGVACSCGRDFCARAAAARHLPTIVKVVALRTPLPIQTAPNAATSTASRSSTGDGFSVAMVRMATGPTACGLGASTSVCISRSRARATGNSTSPPRAPQGLGQELGVHSVVRLIRVGQPRRRRCATRMWPKPWRAATQTWCTTICGEE